jgi:hypothetical protein
VSAAPLEAPCVPRRGIPPFERDAERAFEDFGHVSLGAGDAEDLAQADQLLAECPSRGEAEVEDVRSGGLEESGRSFGAGGSRRGFKHLRGRGLGGAGGRGALADRRRHDRPRLERDQVFLHFPLRHPGAFLEERVDGLRPQMRRKVSRGAEGELLLANSARICGKRRATLAT